MGADKQTYTGINKMKASTKYKIAKKLFENRAEVVKIASKVELRINFEKSKRPKSSYNRREKLFKRVTWRNLTIISTFLPSGQG